MTSSGSDGARCAFVDGKRHQREPSASRTLDAK
jgi:hypothetical protein